MAINDLIKIAIGVTVGIILVTGLIWPVISDYSEDKQIILSNPTTNPMEFSEDPETFNYSAVYNFTTNIYTVDGVEDTQTNFTILMSDVMQASVNGDQFILYGFHIGSDDQNGLILRSSDYTGDMTISVVNGVITINYNETDYTGTASEFVAAYDPEGTHAMISRNSEGEQVSFYVNGIEDISGCANIFTRNLGYAWFVGASGAIAGNGLTLSLDADKLDEYSNAYQAIITDYVFDTTLGTNTDGTNFSPYQALVPMSIITYDKASGVNVNLLGVVGLMVVLLLVVTVARNLNMRG